MSNTVICVDLSRYQAGFNFQEFKDGGGLGVILKASEGRTSRDPNYSAFRRQALDAGLAVASYHFLRPGDMDAQAQFFLNVVKPRQTERLVADYEDEKLNLDDLVAFLQAIHSARPDVQLTVYGGHFIKQQLGSGRNDWLAENTSLWIAQFTSQSKPSWPTGTWKTWSLWQYADNGRVPGYGSPLDCDRFRGSNRNFLKWMGPATASTQAVAA